MNNMSNPAPRNNLGNSQALAVFYDGWCPLCVKEMRHLRKIDSHRLITMVDVRSDDAMQAYPKIDTERAIQKLHALDSDGRLLLGLDATHACWDAVGKGWMTGWLRWPGVRRVADASYWFFAKHRNVIAKVLTGQAQCQHCSLD